MNFIGIYVTFQHVITIVDNLSLVLQCYVIDSSSA